MERNEKCFCGSGIKYKKCHYGMKENSISGEIIKFYDKIDKKVENDVKERNMKITCKEGCSECCYHYFPITEGEFAVIIDYLIKENGKEYVNKIISKGLKLNEYFKKEFPKYYKQLEEDTTGYNREENLRTMFQNMPEKQGFKCVFLDDNDRCSVYKVRPFICRQHGVCYTDFEVNHVICSHILSSEEAKPNMTNIEEFIEVHRSFETFRANKYNINITRRIYPIFYFMKIYFENGQNLDMYLNHPVQKMLFDCPKDEFANKIIDINKKPNRLK